MSDLTPKEVDLLARLDDKPELQPHFFKKAKGLKWFHALKERGYFKAEINQGAEPSGEEGYVSIVHWPATDYLVNIAPDLAGAGQQKVAREVLSILWDVTKDALDREISNYRTWWQFSRIVRHIPIDLINIDEFNTHARYWLKDPYDRSLVADELGRKWLPELLAVDSDITRSISLVLLRLLYTTEIRESELAGSQHKEARFATDNWHLEKITEAVAKEAGVRLGIDACQVFSETLECLLKGMENDGYSCIWRPAIEDHDQNVARNDALATLIVAFRECLTGFISANSEEAITFVSNLLDGPLETLKRVAIHAIGGHFTTLKPLADQALIPEHFQTNLRHEMWHLLNKRFAEMDPEQQHMALDYISSLERIGDDGKIDLGHTAYAQAGWLAAIRDHSPELRKRYQEAVEVAGAEPEHPDFSSYHTSGFVSHESPIPRDELAALSVDELVEYLASYEDSNERGGPDIEGLIDALKTVIKDEPLRYSPHLSRFVDLDLCYAHAILATFTDIWKNKSSLPWDDVWADLLSFAKTLIAQGRFWSPENAEQRHHFIANRHWVVSDIARLIESGVQSDEWAFSPKFLPQSLDILRTLLSKQGGTDFKEDTDAVSVAINSPRGQCLEALINLALRSCRLADSDDEEHTAVWADFEQLFTVELERPGNYEFATLVAMYLPNFLYLSKEWALAHLEAIFNTEDQLHWRCAMQGYSYVNRVYESVYEYLRDHGHLIRVLNDGSLSDNVSTKVIQHVALAYLRGSEDLTDETSMISTLLARCQQDEIGQIIWFLWTLRESEDQKLAPKVLELWPRIWAVIDTDTKVGKKLASRLCMWIAFLHTIDNDNRALASQSIRFADADHNGYQMLEELARISEKQPEEAAALWKDMLEGSMPDYPIEAIQQVFGNLVATGEDGVRTAREIASVYISRGTERPYQWLNEILDGGANV